VSITVTPITPSFVAEISDIDLAQPLRPNDREAIEAAINRYAVVVFRGQTLTDAQQIDFAAEFGPIHAPGQRARHTGIKHRLERTELADISNLDVIHIPRFAAEGKIVPIDPHNDISLLAPVQVGAVPDEQLLELLAAQCRQLAYQQAQVWAVMAELARRDPFPTLPDSLAWGPERVFESAVDEIRAELAARQARQERPPARQGRRGLRGPAERRAHAAHAHQASPRGDAQ